MKGWLALRYAALTRRERLLLTVAGSLTGLVVMAYGVILPVGYAYAAAELRHRNSLERSGRIGAALAAIDRAPAMRGSAVGSIDTIVGQAADATGVVLQTNQLRSDGEALAGATGVRVAAAFGWLEALADSGLVVDGLTMTPAPDGTVAVNVVVRRVKP
jgi:general secretion pathway protein M